MSLMVRVRVIACICLQFIVGKRWCMFLCVPVAVGGGADIPPLLYMYRLWYRISGVWACAFPASNDWRH